MRGSARNAGTDPSPSTRLDQDGVHVRRARRSYLRRRDSSEHESYVAARKGEDLALKYVMAEWSKLLLPDDEDRVRIDIGSSEGSCGAFAVPKNKSPTYDVSVICSYRDGLTFVLVR